MKIRIQTAASQTRSPIVQLIIANNPNSATKTKKKAPVVNTKKKVPAVNNNDTTSTTEPYIY